MRVAIVTESFLPQVNGVANTVRHVVDRLAATGHEPLVVAPGPGPTSYGGAEVVRVRSVALPGYKSFPLGLPDRAVQQALERFGPDIVHLASPIMLGAVGLRAARRLDVPTVAVYQTDVAGFAKQYGAGAEAVVGRGVGRGIDRWVAHLHRRADRNLVPSRSSWEQLASLDVPELHLWRRGVALDLFDPGHRDEEQRRTWTGGDGRTVVGYVGRLAQEKQVRRLLELDGLRDVHLVVIGDGPEREWLQDRLPHATFTGMLRGAELARAFAGLDVFVHTGEAETFCQTVQEAQASGVAVVAPAAGGPLDLVDHGRTGCLYDVADPAALRATVEGLVADPVGRVRMARAGRRAVAGRSWATVVDELVGHYDAVLGAAPARVAA
ncbi:glycosyltransferase family 4 protein [Nocardioides sp. SYSU DS0663]|uniref:glycosyltransferase family 4 protein n=1 Tax=Nocardioides sp. SYSU DS0663 TaxID=3416445 RepID=UPI003F4C02BA